MRLTLIVFAALLLLFGLNGCLNDNSPDDMRQEWPRPVVFIENAEVGEAIVTFDLLIGVPGSGWELTEPEIEADENDYLIRYYGIPPEVGLPAMGTLPATISFYLVPGETYTFRFWQSAGETLDTTIVYTLPG